MSHRASKLPQKARFSKKQIRTSFSELRKKQEKVKLQKYKFCPLEKAYKSQSEIILKGIGSLIQ